MGRLNEWNDERWWPCASICHQDGHHSSWTHRWRSLGAAAYVCEAMVSYVTGVIAEVALEFFRRLNAKPANREDLGNSTTIPGAA